MPKLNTTIDNLEWRSNKIVSTNTAAPDTWTDAQYPSAKLLLNIAHPVGSVLTTSTNTNPASTLGGTWELVDKTFKETYITLTSDHWAATNAALSNYSNAFLSDHNLALRLHLTTNIALTDDNSFPLGTLNLASLGASQLTYSIFYNTTISDDGNCSLTYRIDQDGLITVPEVLNVNGTHNMASGSNFFIHTVIPVDYGKMLDSFCDKFYWKRTA